MENLQPTACQKLLKAIEVAEVLNISKSMAYRLMQTHEIPTVSIGKAKRVRPVDLDSYIHQNLNHSDNSKPPIKSLFCSTNPEYNKSDSVAP
jgi:excisionase family DNA binding protein